MSKEAAVGAWDSVSYITIGTEVFIINEHNQIDIRKIAAVKIGINNGDKAPHTVITYTFAGGGAVGYANALNVYETLVEAREQLKKWGYREWRFNGGSLTYFSKVKGSTEDKDPWGGYARWFKDYSF